MSTGPDPRDKEAIAEHIRCTVPAMLPGIADRIAESLGEYVQQARGEGLAVAEGLLRQVVDYWDGRPTTHHGDHIYADVRDVLRAITPASALTEDPS